MLGRWQKAGDNRWLADGIRGTWEVSLTDDRWYELNLFREDLTTRWFGRFRDRHEGEHQAFTLDERGN